MSAGKSKGPNKYTYKISGTKEGELIKCFNCDFVAKTKHELRYHEVVDHIENYEPPKTTCPHCDKNFYSDRYLKYHITNEHKTNLKVLIEDESECAITITVPVVEGALPNLEMFCESCNYKTSNRKYWDRHLKGHNSININIKDMIVGCNFCDFNTNHEDSLEGHVATKHPRKRKINDDQENDTEENDLKKFDEKSSLANESSTDAKPQEKHAKFDSSTSNDNNVSKNSIKSTEDIISCPECLFQTDDLDKITDHRNKFH